MQFHETRLPNGLTVIAELNEWVHSVGVGFFVRTGSRDESPEVSGVSHFLEHMVFKGYGDLISEDINRVFDDIGANYNASTSEEITQFYAAILPEYLPAAFETLAGMMTPALREADFITEKEVILNEIGDYADQPGFTAYEKAMQAHFAGHPLGQSILGSTESITALTIEQMREYHAEHYKAENITLAVAGNTSWETILELAEKYCAHWPAGGHERPVFEATPELSRSFVHQPQVQQEHLMGMIPAPPADSPLRYAAELLSVIIGDYTGSRMYWEIVDPGYADSADFGYAEYDGSGAYLYYLSCTPEDVEVNLSRLDEILQDVMTSGVTANEIEQARNKVASRIVLASERPMGRLGSLGGNWVYRNEYRSVEADLETIKILSADEIQELLKAYPLNQTTIIGIGPREELV